MLLPSVSANRIRREDAEPCNGSRKNLKCWGLELWPWQQVRPSSSNGSRRYERSLDTISTLCSTLVEAKGFWEVVEMIVRGQGGEYRFCNEFLSLSATASISLLSDNVFNLIKSHHLLQHPIKPSYGQEAPKPSSPSRFASPNHSWRALL